MVSSKRNFDLLTILIIVFTILVIVVAGVLLSNKKDIYCIVDQNETNATNQNIKLLVNARGQGSKIRTDTGAIIDSNYYELEVSKNGVYTFAAVVGGKSSECSINVTNIDRDKPTITINSSTKNRVLALNLVINANDSNGLADEPYSWDNKTWTKNNQLNIIKNGTYTGYVKDYAGNVASTSYKVTNIGNPTIAEKLTMEINSIKQLIVDEGTVKTWKSNNSNVATVDSNGTVTTKIEGVVTITAVLTNNDLYTWTINVIKPNITSITLNMTNVKLKPGETANVMIKGIKPSNATCGTISWKSNRTGVATIKNGVITAVSEGIAIINVFCDTISASVNVTVEKSDNPIIPSSVFQKYESSTLKYYIEKKDNYYMTYIWMEEPYLQIKKLDANVATYDKILTDTELREMKLNRMNVGEMTDAYIANKRIPASKGAIAFNASGFYLSGTWNPPSSYYNLRSDSWFVITESITTRNIQNDNQRNRQIIGIDLQGNLKYYGTAADAATKAKIANNIYKDKVTNTFSFGPLLLSTEEIEINEASSALRQAICQIDGNNYAMLTTINRMTLNQVKTALYNIGCQTAFNLDGGGSTSMVYKNANASTSTQITCNGGGSSAYCRDIVEGIYFVEK